MQFQTIYNNIEYIIILIQCGLTNVDKYLNSQKTVDNFLSQNDTFLHFICDLK